MTDPQIFGPCLANQQTPRHCRLESASQTRRVLLLLTLEQFQKLLNYLLALWLLQSTQLASYRTTVNHWQQQSTHVGVNTVNNTPFSAYK